MKEQAHRVPAATEGKEQKTGVKTDGEAEAEPPAKQIRRRGLLAAAVALGAAAVAKLAGPERAQAANGANWIIGTGLPYPTSTLTTGLDYDGVGGFGLEVNGQTGPALAAINGNTSGAGNIGVTGGSGSGAGFGVLGDALGAGGVGVQGGNGSTTGLGVRGVHKNNGTGLKGVSNTGGSSADGDGSGTGVHGKSSGGNGVLGQSDTWYGVGGVSNSNVGVYGTSNAASGVYGTSTTGVGVYGNSVGSATGVFGAGTNYVGGYFQSTNNIGLQGVSMTPNVPAIYGISTVAPGASRRAAQFDGNVIVNGDFAVTGAKAAVVPHPDGSLRTVYCVESPESYFEDFGEATLAKGVAVVALDPDFAVLVQTGQYQVFLTPEGDCRGVYVSSKGPQGFEVRELQGGTSDLPFSYRVVAKRKDIAAPRLQKLDRERVRAFGLKQHSAPPPLTLPADQVFPEPARPPERSRPGVPQVPPTQPQVPPGRR